MCLQEKGITDPFKSELARYRRAKFCREIEVMFTAAYNQPGQLPRALAPKTDARRSFRAYHRAAGILLAVFVAISHISTGMAAEVNLGITFSPEAARMVRDWRRANGLPQAAEQGEVKPAAMYSSCCGVCSAPESANKIGMIATSHPVSLGTSTNSIASQRSSAEMDDGYCTLTHTSV
jgi:hypothetical protein